MQTTVVNIKDRTGYDVYIGRKFRMYKDGTFGNPFKVGQDGEIEEVLEKFREYFLHRVNTDAEFRNKALALKGKRLGCFCAPNPCHGRIIAEWLDSQA